RGAARPPSRRARRVLMRRDSLPHLRKTADPRGPAVVILLQRTEALLGFEHFLGQRADLFVSEFEEEFLLGLLLVLELLLFHVEVGVVRHAGAGRDDPS